MFNELSISDKKNLYLLVNYINRQVNSKLLEDVSSLNKYKKVDVDSVINYFKYKDKPLKKKVFFICLSIYFSAQKNITSVKKIIDDMANQFNFDPIERNKLYKYSIDITDKLEEIIDYVS